MVGGARLILFRTNKRKKKVLRGEKVLVTFQMWLPTLREATLNSTEIHCLKLAVSVPNTFCDFVGVFVLQVNKLGRRGKRKAG